MYPDLCTVSLLLYPMGLKTISPGCGVQASLMLFYFMLYSYNTMWLMVQNVLMTGSRVHFPANAEEAEVGSCLPVSKGFFSAEGQEQVGEVPSREFKIQVHVTACLANQTDDIPL